MSKLGCSVGLVAAFGSPAFAETFNISFSSSAADQPSATYAAAGRAGTWNTVSGFVGQTWNLVDTDGSPTSVTMLQTPTNTSLAVTDTSISGDDAKLLNHGLDTTSAETCVELMNVQPGLYELLIYAWTPDAPAVLSRTRQDEAPSTIDVGGAWTGGHAEGVTYARYQVTVDHSGVLWAHSGRAPSQASAALNGIQVRLLDGTVGGANDAGPNDPGPGASGDAGLDSATHHGGCEIGGDQRFGAVLVAAALLLVRRRRR